MDIGRRVADDHYGRLPSQPPPDLFDPVLEYLLAQLAAVAERSEREVPRQSCRRELGPADGFQVSRDDAEQFARRVQPRQQFRYGRAQLDADLGSVTLHLVA